MKSAVNSQDNRTVGAVSISLLAAAFLIGAYSIFIYNRLAAFIYILVVTAGYVLNVYYYCRKCPHITDDSCRFVVFSKIARLFPDNMIGKPYSTVDVVIIWLPRLFMFFFPRAWLFRQKILFIVFWVLILVALYLWVTRVCRTCRNEKCPFRKMSEFQKHQTQ
jgi:hypothetical protein